MKKLNIGLTFFYYLTVFFGACPFVYDSKAQVLRISIIRSAVGVVFYGAAMFAMFPLGFLAINSLRQSEFLAKDFATIIGMSSEYAKNFVNIISLIFFIKNRNGFLEVFNRILDVDEEIGQNGISSESENWFTFTVGFKVGIASFIYCLHFVWFFLGFKDLNLLLILVMWSHNAAFLFQLFTICYFNLAVASISKCWKIMNIRLLDIYRQYKTLKVSALSKEQCGFLSDQLDGTVIFYKKLYELHANLRGLYQIQITGWATTSFLNNVSISFMTYTLFFGEKFQWVFVTLLGGLALISFLDFFITWSICESNLDFYRDTMNILRMFSMLRSLDFRFDRTVECYLLKLKKIPYQI